MARGVAVLILAILAFAGAWTAQASRDKTAVSQGFLQQRRELIEPTGPDGWWHAMRSKGGRFCSLKDFPPRPDGYGSSLVICGGPTFDHYFLWSLEKVTGSGAPVNGDAVYLKIFNPMLSYCRVRSNNANLECGVTQARATQFVIEKETAAPTGSTIDFVSDVAFLKNGNRWCSINPRSRGRSAYVKCNALRNAATGFTFPANSFSYVSLTSQLSNQACGSNFFDDSPTIWFNCSRPNAPGASVNFKTEWVVSRKVPGAFSLTSGLPLAFKVYDSLYRYQVINLKVNSQGRIFAADNDTEGANVWLILEAIGAQPGSALADGAAVALKAEQRGLYCGISAANQNALLCDQPGPASALPSGYRFTLGL